MSEMNGANAAVATLPTEVPAVAPVAAPPEDPTPAAPTEDKAVTLPEVPPVKWDQPRFNLTYDDYFKWYKGEASFFCNDPALARLNLRDALLGPPLKRIARAAVRAHPQWNEYLTLRDEYQEASHRLREA